MNGHTKGPWHIGFDDGSGVGDGAYIVAADGTVVVRGGSPEGDLEYGVQWEADARLIATAPILLQELRGANTQMEMAAECIEAGRYDEALLHVRSMSRSRRAAIDEATGEQP